MRYALLLLLAPALLATGCSIFIAKAGKELPAMRDRHEAHAAFGAPVTTGTEEGRSFEEFSSRVKWAEPSRASSHSMALGMSMCLYEFYLFPRELWFLAKCGLLGQTIRVTYNPDGSVRSSYIDGRWTGSATNSEK